jgi:hypothetical protein
VGKWLAVHMDLMNLENFDLKSHTSIDFGFLIIRIRVW